jgi:hypothetical protein
MSATLTTRRIFVFGSNKAGRHGAGAALTAKRKHGAIQGQGLGPAGESYAISTKDAALNPLSLADIKHSVETFLGYARENSHLEFQITQIGCGLAGFRPSVIALLFASAPSNCLFDERWREWLPQTARFWGTF